MPLVYSNVNVPVLVPVSVTCSSYYGNQLYASGSAFDSTANSAVGSVNTFIQSVNGGTSFSGQLGFNLPSSTQGHSVQVSVSIYSSQYGNLLTVTSETFQVNSATQQVTTTTTTQTATSPYPYPYPTPPFQYQSETHSYRHQYATQSQNTDVFAYVAIAAILAAVIIATAGLVVYGRRQPTWYPMPPPPSR